MNFQDTLKQLHQQAKAETKARELAAAIAKNSNKFKQKKVSQNS